MMFLTWGKGISFSNERIVSYFGVHQYIEMLDESKLLRGNEMNSEITYIVFLKKNYIPSYSGRI